MLATRLYHPEPQNEKAANGTNVVFSAFITQKNLRGIFYCKRQNFGKLSLKNWPEVSQSSGESQQPRLGAGVLGGMKK